jgi:predicted enzyme related to lactoylglutathione lyase
MTPAILVGVAVLLLAGGAAAQSPPAPREGKTMQRVDGIGGVFFRAKDPKALAKWYADHLGVSGIPDEYGQQPWRQAAGPTAFAPFPADTTYFGRPEQAFMLNFRVPDLDAMAAQLRAADIAVEVEPQAYPNGRFALIHDPEGNPIQLWEPKEPKR